MTSQAHCHKLEDISLQFSPECFILFVLSVFVQKLKMLNLTISPHFLDFLDRYSYRFTQFRYNSFRDVGHFLGYRKTPLKRSIVVEDCLSFRTIGRWIQTVLVRQNCIERQNYHSGHRATFKLYISMMYHKQVSWLTHYIGRQTWMYSISKDYIILHSSGYWTSFWGRDA